MPILREWLYWEVEHDGTKRFGGSRSSPLEITVDGQFLDKDFSLATATSLTIWNSAEAVATFAYVWLICDQDLKVEVTCDRAGDNGLEEFVFVIEANTPFRLVYDDALANYSGTLSAGTADVVDEIVIRNESGTTANGRFFLAK